MLAGQIHDVDRVAMVVQEIKTVLEQRQGERLEKVAVAVVDAPENTARQLIKILILKWNYFFWCVRPWISGGAASIK